jgi:hypothetical protein
MALPARRYKVVGVYPQRNAKSTLSFLEPLVEEMPFPPITAPIWRSFN